MPACTDDQQHAGDEDPDRLLAPPQRQPAEPQQGHAGGRGRGGMAAVAEQAQASFKRDFPIVRRLTQETGVQAQ
ncbi:hypothetical protein [Comamonas serinivorans]|nr:hypothetical protein [Comamonas serinivorans]